MLILFIQWYWYYTKQYLPDIFLFVEISAKHWLHIDLSKCRDVLITVFWTNVRNGRYNDTPVMVKGLQSEVWFSKMPRFPLKYWELMVLVPWSSTNTDMKRYGIYKRCPWYRGLNITLWSCGWARMFLFCVHVYYTTNYCTVKWSTHVKSSSSTEPYLCPILSACTTCCSRANCCPMSQRTTTLVLYTIS